MTINSILYKQTEDTLQVLKWKAALVRKLDAWECRYKFHTNENPFSMWYENAAMNVLDTDFDKHPTLIMGYIPNLEDNYRAPLIMAHEMGHIIDLRKHKNSLRYIHRVLGDLEMEVSAWENGFRILREIGWTDWEDALELAMEALKTYFFSDRYKQVDAAYGFTGEVPTWSEALERMETAKKSAEKAQRMALLGY